MATVRKTRSYGGVTREVTAKLRSGASITDGELSNMLSMLKTLEKILAVMPEDYGLALRDVRIHIDRLQGYQDARQRDRG